MIPHPRFTVGYLTVPSGTSGTYSPTYSVTLDGVTFSNTYFINMNQYSASRTVNFYATASELIQVYLSNCGNIRKERVGWSVEWSYDQDYVNHVVTTSVTSVSTNNRESILESRPTQISKPGIVIKDNSVSGEEVLTQFPGSTEFEFRSSGTIRIWVAKDPITYAKLLTRWEDKDPELCNNLSSGVVVIALSQAEADMFIRLNDLRLPRVGGSIPSTKNDDGTLFYTRDPQKSGDTLLSEDGIGYKVFSRPGTLERVIRVTLGDGLTQVKRTVKTMDTTQVVFYDLKPGSTNISETHTTDNTGNESHGAPKITDSDIVSGVDWNPRDEGDYSGLV